LGLGLDLNPTRYDPKPASKPITGNFTENGTAGGGPSLQPASKAGRLLAQQQQKLLLLLLCFGFGWNPNPLTLLGCGLNPLAQNPLTHYPLT